MMKTYYVVPALFSVLFAAVVLVGCGATDNVTTPVTTQPVVEKMMEDGKDAMMENAGDTDAMMEDAAMEVADTTVKELDEYDSSEELLNEVDALIAEIDNI